MRWLLTGYAVVFNRRYNRSGRLFQNRYKSILCQEDAYLLELVRYIHLNPIRAQLVENMEALGHSPYSGHSNIMGKISRQWQDITDVLVLFGNKTKTARRRYKTFVKKLIKQVIVSLKNNNCRTKGPKLSPILSRFWTKKSRLTFLH